MLTMVPSTIPPMSATESGNWRSAPILPLTRNGAMARMVVREVMMIGVSLLLPPTMMALTREYSFLRRLMVSTLRMESLMIMPHITTIPIMDIMFNPAPHIHNANNAPDKSATISDRIISGCTKDSNWAARMK